ncbi:MAG: hypothetical protein ACTSVZ_04895 [Promethearchaeota archaeon]
MSDDIEEEKKKVHYRLVNREYRIEAVRNASRTSVRSHDDVLSPLMYPTSYFSTNLNDTFTRTRKRMGSGKLGGMR